MAGKKLGTRSLFSRVSSLFATRSGYSTNKLLTRRGVSVLRLVLKRAQHADGPTVG